MDPGPGAKAVDGTVRRRIRVVIADDSPTVRVAIREILKDDPGIEIVGVATNGLEVVDLVLELQPDVVSMDVAMPQLDGVEAIRRIMAKRPTPIVVVSGLPDAERESIAFEAIAAGAVDVTSKPSGDRSFRDPTVRRRFIAHLKNMANVSVIGRRVVVERGAQAVESTASSASIIAIASSTGGPPTLSTVLGSLGPKSPPVLLVQHMAESFLPSFVRWLDSQLAVTAVLAVSGVRPEPGHVYVSPGNRHLEISPIGTLRVHDGPEVRFHRPSGTPLFDSVCSFSRGSAIGVVLTGMGRDGAEALGRLRASGAVTIAQDPATCVVPGMPGAAIEVDAVKVVATPEEIGKILGSVTFVPRRE